MALLKPKMIRYNSKGGYTIEFHEPGSVYLDFEEAFIAATFFEGLPSEEKVKEHFTPGERVILQRFIDLWLEEMELLSEQYANIRSVDVITRKVKGFLSLWFATETEEKRSKIEGVFGWKYIKATESRMDQVVREKLKETWQTKEIFEKVLSRKQLGKINPLLLQELEDRYGKFDLDES